MTASNTAAALADAFAALAADGPVTVRRLREMAGVSTAAAADWLRANRPSRDVPEVPAEALVPALAPLWSAAVAAARDEQAEADAAERAALVDAEGAALNELAVAIARADDAEAEIRQLHGRVADLEARATAAESERDAQAALAAVAKANAAEAAAACHAAEVLAAEAQATAKTLREVLDTLSRPPGS